MKKRVLIVTTGGTIFQREINGKMSIEVNPNDLISQLDIGVEYEIEQISKRTGAEITFSTLGQILDKFETASGFDGLVLITGTDSMEEVAFALDVAYTGQTPIIICGAMKPNDVVGYDGVANLRDAVLVSISPEALGMGVMIVMNDNIHPARYVRKRDSALIGSFESQPGPIGQIRCGQPIFYYAKLPINFHNHGWQLNESVDRLQVPIWTMAVNSQIPQSVLEQSNGLVIAGMGTGSISESMIEQLAPDWTAKLPIILATRCWEGLSYDDSYYRGSRQKYEDKGFKILGYEDLNPLQARIKLILEISQNPSAL